MAHLGPEEQTDRGSENNEFDELDQRSAGERADEVKPGRRRRQWGGGDGPVRGSAWRFRTRPGVALRGRLSELRSGGAVD